MVISVDTQQLTQAADELMRQADIVAQRAEQLTALLRKRRESQRMLWIFKKSNRDIDAFARQSADIAAELRRQSLYFKECAKRYRSIQSVAVVRAEKLGERNG
jgi:hypothetical protein